MLSQIRLQNQPKELRAEESDLRKRFFSCTSAKGVRYKVSAVLCTSRHFYHDHCLVSTLRAFVPVWKGRPEGIQ